MKICAIIAEYNPLHEGHIHHLRQAKASSGADAVLCIMSGNFVQRGENAVLDKYERASHAIKAGADAVIELPTVFATSSAELFAKGGVKMANAIPKVAYLSFGAETPDREKFYETAALLNDEPPSVSAKIKAALAAGKSFVKARAEAYENELLLSPNDLLGVEYTRAIYALSSKIEILPIARIGAGYKEETLSAYPSATAVRKTLFEGKREELKAVLPEYVFSSLSSATSVENTLKTLEKHAVLSTATEELKKINDCAEGLENALKKAAATTEDVVDGLTSARYTSSRIRRILLQTLLRITREDIFTALKENLYLRLLAVKKDSPILSALGESEYPLLVGGTDENKLSPMAKYFSEKDAYAQSVYTLLTGNVPDKKIFF